MKGNFLDVPTDCPTRERLGWTGGAQIFFHSGAYLMNTAPFFCKWLRRMGDKPWLTYMSWGEDSFIELFSIPAARRKQIPDPKNNLNYTHFALEVSDLKLFREQVLRRGGAPYIDTEIAMGIEHTWQMWMHDPDGNPFEVMEYTPQSYQITGRLGGQIMYNSIRPGREWLDTNGKPIQAHGFSVFYSEKDGLYYWFGENKEKTDGKGTVWHWGVRCYSSKDLYNWEDRGLIIPPQPDDLQSPLHPSYCMDRPHILYCAKTGKYVAWLKIMCSTTSQFMSVMQADRFLGPYEFVHKIYKPLDMDTGDFALAVDSATKKAYFIFDRPHFEIVTATLSDDYTSVTGEFSEHYVGLHPPFSREAPTS